MSDYYVQLDGDFYTDGFGNGTQADPYNGPVLDCLLNGLAGLGADPGDRIFVRGTLNLGGYHCLENITIASGSFLPGDLIGNAADPAAATIRARVVDAPTGAMMYVWSPDEITDGFPATNYSRPGQAFVSSDITRRGIDVRRAGDQFIDHLRVIGCPPDAWSPDGTRAVLDGQSAAINCLTLGAGWIWLENLHLKRSAGALLSSLSGAQCHVIRACEFSLSGATSYAVVPNYGYYSAFIGCYVHHNAALGLLLNQQRAVDCVVADNSGHGIFAGALSVVESCLIASNGNGGVLAGNGALVRRCVIDGNGGDGVSCAYTNAMVADSRITHNDGWGLNAPAGAISLRNIFADNGADGASHTNAPAGGLDDLIASDDGYVDRVAGNYALRTDALGRRRAVTLPDGNLHHASAGLAPNDLRRDMQLSFPRHEVTFP